MSEFTVLWKIGCFSVTGYNLCFLAGLLMSIALVLFLGRKTPGIGKTASFTLAVLAGGMIGGRIVYVLMRLPLILSNPDYYGVSFILHPWEGGYTLYGAVLGGAIAGLIYGKVTKQKTGDFFDILSPAAALTLCSLRIGEFFTSQGMGHMVEEESLQHFPFAVMNVWGDWCQPVFIYEAAAALAVMAVLLIYRAKGKGNCRLWEIFLVLLSASQILFESFREDEIIRFGFVRFTQLAAISTVGIVLGVRIWKSVKCRGFRPSHAVRIAVFAAVVLVCIAIEFALDKSTISNHLLYLVMAFSLVALGADTLTTNK